MFWFAVKVISTADPDFADALDSFGPVPWSVVPVKMPSVNQVEQMSAEKSTLRTAVWGGLYENHVGACYWGKKAKALRGRIRQVKGALLFLSSGAVATILFAAPGWVIATVSILTAALAAYHFVREDEKQLNEVSSIQGEWIQIVSDYDRLWLGLQADRIDGPAAWSQFEDLQERGTAVQLKEKDLEYDDSGTASACSDEVAARLLGRYQSDGV
jgi:hypothetical protein